MEQPKVCFTVKFTMEEKFADNFESILDWLKANTNEACKIEVERMGD